MSLDTPDRPAPAYAPPATPLERQLAAIWQEFLGAERVGLHDDFFALGGHSMLALRMVGRLRQDLGVDLPLARLFEVSTVARLAGVVTELQAQVQVQVDDALLAQIAQLSDEELERELARRAAGEGGPLAALGSAGEEAEPGEVPISPHQRWFAETFDVERQTWALTVLWEVPPGLALDRDRLRAAATALVAHHDALRLRYHRASASAPWGVYIGATAEPPPVEVHAVTAEDAEERRRAVLAIASELQHRMSIVRGPVLAFTVCEMQGREQDKLVICIHHSVYDAYSLDIVFEDLLSAYMQLATGQSPVLPAASASYGRYLRAFAQLRHGPELARARAFWLQPARLLETPPLPVDLPGGRHTDRNTRRHATPIDAELAGQIRGWLSQAPEATLNDLLLFGVTRALAQWTGAPAVRVDFEHNGRSGVISGVDLVRMVGPTTVKVPLRFALDPAAPAARALREVQETFRETLAHAAGYGLLRFGEPGPDRERLAASRAPQVFFNNRGLTVGRVAPPPAFGAFQTLTFRRPDGEENAISHDLMIECDNTPAGPVVSWVFSSAQYREETIAAIARAALDEVARLCAGS
jgi:acyl carrier protein